MNEATPRWLVLFHHLPPKPDYLRVKVRRRLERLGALPLKNSVYVLPHRAETREDFQWLAAEIRGERGDALLCDATFLDGITDGEITERFREAAGEKYRELAGAARGRLERHTRLRSRLADVVRTDFFASDARAEAETAISELRATSSLPDRGASSASAAQSVTRSPSGGLWVTRADVFVDRLASAWLIRRFIDRDARFKFVAAVRYPAQLGEIRFDMPGGEYTHDGDRCTFEVLCSRFGLSDSPIVAIGEVVHDIDLKDDKFDRAEAEGIELVLRGIARSTPSDDKRIELASPVFDGLYAQYTGHGP